MPNATHPRLPLRFGWNHFLHEGRTINLLDALDLIDADEVCLEPFAEPFEASLPDPQAIAQRLEHTRLVINKLARRGIHADIALPGLTNLNPTAPTSRKLRQAIFASLGALRPRRVWIDDTLHPHHRSITGAKLHDWLRTIGQLIRRKRSSATVGLLAADFHTYEALGTTACHCAGLLAGQRPPLLAFSQGFDSDERRTDVLNVAQNVALACAYNNQLPRTEFWGLIDQAAPSTFRKSAEATQMQINLNLLHGITAALHACTDPGGMALREGDRIAEMHNQCSKFWRQLVRRIPSPASPLGIGVLVPAARVRPGRPQPASSHDAWLRLLWRLGLPAVAVTPDQIHDHPGPFAAAGPAIAGLSRTQLRCLFEKGIALDAAAAAAIEKHHGHQYTGSHVTKPLTDALEDIHADQTFAVAHYSHRIAVAAYDPAIHSIEPVAPGARSVTILRRRGRLPATPGAALFDDVDHNRRSLTLPFAFGPAEPNPLLCPARQQHLQDLFAWLHRGRLLCRVETTPDLVPFLVPIGRKKLLLALLNIGFDWAMDARIQFGDLGFKPKRVRVLEEHGTLDAYKDLVVTRHHDYCFLQLSPNAAVAPMQMTLLLLEG